MDYSRSYKCETDINVGSGVVAGTKDNQVKIAASGDFIGVYPFENGKLNRKANEHIGIVVSGGPFKVLVSGVVNAGKKAVLNSVVGKEGTFKECPTVAGTYSICGMFLENGAIDEYVEMIVERSTHVVV